MPRPTSNHGFILEAHHSIPKVRHFGPKILSGTGKSCHLDLKVLDGSRDADECLQSVLNVDQNARGVGRGCEQTRTTKPNREPSSAVVSYLNHMSSLSLKRHR